MQPEITYEVLQFLTRDDLECLQLVRRSLRDMIVARSKKLALRPIRSVVATGTRWIYIESNRSWFPAPVLDGDFDAVVRRLQHVFIQEFRYDISENTFMEYWMAEKTEFEGKVMKIYLKIVNKVTDYDAIDAHMNFLRPRVFYFWAAGSAWGEDEYDRERLGLLLRESFLNNIWACSLVVSDNTPPPISWILGTTGYRNYELLDVRGGGGCFPSDWFDSFIDSFVRGECVNEKLESVFVIWLCKGDPSAMPKRLREPSESDVCIPREDLVLRRISDEDKVTQCDLFSFTSTDQKKRMDVYMWVVKGYYCGVIFKF